MASEVAFGPVPPPALTRLSVSSVGGTSSSSSSDSPITTPSYDITLRWSSDTYSDDERPVVPKIEELDENGLSQAKPEPIIEDALQPISPTTQRRGRGRPRKHPPSTAIVAKGRSKTGCFTCRKQRTYWKSGKQRRVSLVISPPPELPLLVDGVETDTDRLFLDHFNINVSRVLTVLSEDGNPFRQLLLPMAIKHSGLMHSLLCLAGSHLVLKNPENYEYRSRRAHHFGQACIKLRTDEAMAAHMSGDSDMIIDDPVAASTLVLCLETIVNGDVQGQYRYHMDSARTILQKQRGNPKYSMRDPEFQKFLHEVFLYHDIASSITNVGRYNVMMTENFQLPEFMIQPEAGALLGVVDGMFGILSKIRQIRDRVRDRRTHNLMPLVNFEILSEAQAVDVALRQWTCAHIPGTPRYIASLLYRQTTWIYLRRTVLADQDPDEKLHIAVKEGLDLLGQLAPDDSTQSIVLMPLFLLGCTAYKAEFRPEISQAFDRLQAYSELGNIKYARQIVEHIWDKMDKGHKDVWDWETIISKMGYDFLIT
ncbi:MAG: hypothetical protein M1820_004679 [Bogoriella megaspora]|nr:MAG: hypothetical protein M1820_004679 [Bogoriella megaspora]